MSDDSTIKFMDLAEARGRRIAELEAACKRALRSADAGAGSRQWEKIEDTRAILREALTN